MEPQVQPKRSKKSWSHFRARLLERYGLTMTHEQWLALNHCFARVGSCFISRSSDTKTWWLIDHQGQRIVALYCSVSHSFLSVMPMRYLEKALQGSARRCRYMGLKVEDLEETTKRLKIEVTP